MSNAEKLSITLPTEMAHMIRDRVRAGAYASTSELIRSALRGWMQTERLLSDLDAGVAIGVADADAGRVLAIGDARTILRERLRESNIMPE